MTSTTTDRPIRLSTATVGLRQRIVDIWRYRELLVGMTRTELKVKYKNSALGFVWSMLNPALYLVVYYVVFQLILKNGLPYFTIYLLSGLLVWNLFSAALARRHRLDRRATRAWSRRSISHARSCRSPRSAPRSCTSSCRSLVLFARARRRSGTTSTGRYMPLIVPALLVLLLLAAALGILLSAINVYMRDMQHLLELVLLAWFWGTPIV